MKYPVALLALVALAGCGSKESSKPQGGASEKILPGSASDAMLPYDTASSTPPPDMRQYEGDDAPAPKSRSEGSKAPAAPADEAEDAPEATAT